MSGGQEAACLEDRWDDLDWARYEEWAGQQLSDERVRKTGEELGWSLEKIEETIAIATTFDPASGRK